MGRPRKEINQNTFEYLCSIMCTLTEIAGAFDCCEDTIESWCKRTYKENFSDVYKKKSAGGKISLRRSQFELAKTNASMAIFLGKNYLGQTDSINYESNASIANDGFIEALADTASEDWDDV